MKTILLLTDFSSNDEGSAKFALELAVKSEAELLLFHTIINDREDDKELAPDEIVIENTKNKLEQSVRNLSQISEANYKDYPTSRIRYQYNWGNRINLNNYINDETWIVIMRLKNEDYVLSNFLYGTNASEVINQATCPVLLIDTKTRFDTLKRIALATEFEVKDMEAVKFLAKFSTYFDSQIVLVHDIPETLIDLEEFTLNVKPANDLFPKLYYQVIEKGATKKELQILSSKEHFDMIGFVCKKGNLFRQIYYSHITMALIKHPHVSFFIFPG